MKTIIRAHLAFGCLLLASSFPAMGQGSNVETADVVGQGGGGPIVSMDGATLIRVPNGITISLKMPTPPPGSYTYPDPNAFQDRVEMGRPEVFTGWAFIFNYPDMCNGPCDSDDIGMDKPAKGGAYNFAGHVAGGPRLVLSGHVSVGQTAFAPSHALLENPAGAEVHIAVAPHGRLLPDQLPNQVKMPIGTSAVWWLSFFIPLP